MAGSVNSDSKLSLPWEEKSNRPFADYLMTGFIVFLLALPLYFSLKAQDLNHLKALIFMLPIAIVLQQFWYGRRSWLGVVISVSDQGLHLQHMGWRIYPFRWRLRMAKSQFVPISQIKDIELVRIGKDLSLSLFEYDGKKFGWFRRVQSTIKDVDRVLIFRQEKKGLKRPWWLFKSSQVDELAQALKLAQTNSR